MKATVLPPGACADQEVAGAVLQGLLELGPDRALNVLVNTLAFVVVELGFDRQEAVYAVHEAIAHYGREQSAPEPHGARRTGGGR